ncbi:hypothetical protein ACFY7C_18935 [Streptomyces sp. NPDC012769]|uniref:hypothetical protein n=1 Tax=Streptomyces sp. NPDC012769 TaxID=3364848 RepID=UPI00367F5572
MRGENGVRVPVRAVTLLLVALLSACAGPYQYYEGTGVHDVTAAEVAGTWENVERTRVTLHRDGSALVERLDGADFDFDRGWRLSGTGTWELADRSGGQRVRLTLTKRTAVEARPAATADPAATDGAAGAAGASASADSAPATYTWHFYVDRADGPDSHGDDVVLFFFFGDPDIGNTYVMRRAPDQPPSGTLR